MWKKLTPNPLSIGDVQKVLAKLLKENVSIRNLPIIFETLADYAKLTTDTDILTEYVRQALARQITNQYSQDNRTLKVITRSGKFEKLIADQYSTNRTRKLFSIGSTRFTNIIRTIAKQVEQVSFMRTTPIILCSPAIRMYVKTINRTLFPTSSDTFL